MGRKTCYRKESRKEGGKRKGKDELDVGEND
jgi:hypothetical protein